MSAIPTVKALFPIGKTQWAKWSDKQRTAFNEARAAGVPHADALSEANQAKKKGPSLLEVLHEVADAVETVSGITAAAKPMVKIVKQATQKKGK